MTSVKIAVAGVVGICCAAVAAAQPDSHAMHGGMSPEHSAAAPVTFVELQTTAAQLERARWATEKYRDVHEAEADGYHPIGPDVPGMGIHYVHTAADRRSSAVSQSSASQSSAFDVERPDILLYEKDADSAGGYALVGVSYLFNGQPDTDGQPKNPPFPKSLASWHRHADLCVLPDRSVKAQLSAEQCQALGGQFTELTQWMVHAWIWKDSPAGVFSATNPTVR
jgi:hypothetical protein